MASLGFEDIQLAGITEGLKMCGSGKTFYGYIFVKTSVFGPKTVRHLNLASRFRKTAWAAEMELAREAFATDSAEVDQKEAKKKARTVALEAARVVQPANQQEAAAAATRPTGAQQDTRRSSRVVRKTSLGVDDYFNKTDLQPDDDKYLGEEERRAAQVEKRGCVLNFGRRPKLKTHPRFSPFPPPVRPSFPPRPGTCRRLAADRSC
ncbi:hypothetical protein PLESTB_001813500 [Pleodorina starrii]|uniref:Uncharacterized protein n=1 Tax=Pleodorina starrii TaxID=330485 RepID=A0A9W6FAJ7_9CHLO|nr:hypothetical protein PLESTB_001813500 [Pleodorina starrii]